MPGKAQTAWGVTCFFICNPCGTRWKHKARFLKKETVKSISVLPAAVLNELIEKSKQNPCEIHREAKAFYHHVWFKSELL